MAAIKVGIQLSGLRLPLRKALHTAARLGATAVEIDARGELNPQELSRTGVRQIRKMMDDLSLRVCAVGFRTNRGYGIAQNLERRIEATKEAMHMAHELGAPIVINSVGPVPAEPQGPEWDLLLQVLTDLGRFGQRCGALLAAQTGSEDAADLERLIQALPTGALAVNLNPGNLIMNGYSPREAVTRLGAHILHVHAKDGVRDSGQRRGVEVPLGRGSVDIPELIGALEEQGYHGYYTIERTEASDPEFEIGQAVKFLQSLQ